MTVTKEKQIVVKMTEAEVNCFPFVFAKADPDAGNRKSFYGALIEAISLKSGEMIDCRKMQISKNIQDAWFSYTRSYGVEDFALAMELACSGPKVDASLPDGTVVLEEGCVTC